MDYKKGIIVLLVILTAGCSVLRKTADEADSEPQTVGEVEPVTLTGFKATGNEPFWALEIEFDNLLKFTSLTEEFPEFTFPATGPERVDGLSFVRYSARTYNANTVVEISREECIDTMKGNRFPYRVSLSLKRTRDDDFTVFRGCGQYLGRYRLNDIWVLEKIDGEAVDIPESRQKPTMEVDLAGMTISGYGGCNRYHGKAGLVNNTLVTGNIMSTKMACLDTQEVENRFLKTISSQTLEFEIDEEGLRMTDGETELFFTRAE
ncbi:MAG: META domain-containing protein [Marinilabiliales bacterium]|nr:MAG: META domain-containing protein [Marinilabiliales bacterium]